MTDRRFQVLRKSPGMERGNERQLSAMLHDLSSRSCEGSARRSPRTLLDLQWHYPGRHADADPGTCLGTRGRDWRCLRRSADTSALRSLAAAACGDTCQADAGRAAWYTGYSSARRT